MKYFLFIVLLLLPFAVRADERRYHNVFTSPNGKFELKLLRHKSGNWAMYEKASGKIIYSLEVNNLSSMTVLIGDDGKSVVAVDDYSEQNPEGNPEVLFFYRDGNRTKTYKLNELYANPDLITQSVSHFRWLDGGAKTFAIRDSKLSLTTFELNNFLFDAETGAVLKKERDEILSGESVFVYGRVKNLGGDKHEIEAECVIHGAIAKGGKIFFESKEFRGETGSLRESLIIGNGQLIARKEIIFNRCK